MSDKRYATEAVITGWIDKYNEDITQMQAQAEALIVKADGLRNTPEAARNGALRSEAERIMTRVDWRRGMIKRLREALAEFKTMPMEPIIGEDTSVPSIQ